MSSALCRSTCIRQTIFQSQSIHQQHTRGLKRDLGRVSVILDETIKNLGEKGDSVEVRRGYARNFLVPRRHAVYDSSFQRTARDMNVAPRHSLPYNQRARVSADEEQTQASSASRRRYANQLLQKINKITVTIHRPSVIEQGVTLTSGRPVTAQTIYQKLVDEFYIFAVAPEDIEIKSHNLKAAQLDSFGDHRLSVKVALCDDNGVWRQENALLNVRLVPTLDSDPVIKLRKAQEKASREAGIIEEEDDEEAERRAKKDKRRK